MDVCCWFVWKASDQWFVKLLTEMNGELDYQTRIVQLNQLVVKEQVPSVTLPEAFGSRRKPGLLKNSKTNL